MTPKQIKRIHDLVPSLPPLSQQATTLNELIYELAGLPDIYPRIQDLDEQQVATTIGDQILVNMSTALGIKKLPVGEDALKMMRFIRFTYGELFPGEVELAFYIILMNTPSEDLKHYGELSIRFLQFVMNKYTTFRKKAIIQVGQAVVMGKTAQLNNGMPTASQLKQIQKESMDVALMMYGKYLKVGNIEAAHMSNRFAWDTLVAAGMTDLEPELLEEYTGMKKELALQYKKMDKSTIGNYLHAIQALNVDNMEEVIAFKDLCLREQFRRYHQKSIDLKAELYGKLK